MIKSSINTKFITCIMSLQSNTFMMTPETRTLTVIFVRRGGDDDDTYPPKDGRAHRTWPTGILLRAKDVAMLFHNIVHQIYGLLSAVSPKNNDARGACLLASIDRSGEISGKRDERDCGDE